MRRSISICLCLLQFLIAGCAAGPDFRQPDVPATEHYGASPPPTETVAVPVPGGAAQQFVLDQDVPAQWWTLFRSPQLDQLVRTALADNPSLEAARARLRAAEETLRAAGGALLLPPVDLKASGGRQRFSPAAIGSPQPPVEFNLYNTSVNVGYHLDLFGAARRELEALRAETDYQQYQLQAARTTLAANVVTTAIRLAALRAQLEATRTLLQAQEQQLGIVERQLALGGASRLQVLAQRSQVAQTRAGLPRLTYELDSTRSLLAVYLGKTPDAATIPELSLADLELPRQLPVSLPSRLVRERPDILAAEAMLHRASAKVGVATANLYPQFTLTASYGSLANRSGDLFTGTASVWNYGLGLTQPLLHGGELRGRRRAAIAAYDQAGAQYREVVLFAFRNVADTLRALELDAQALLARSEAATAAHEAMELAQNQYRLGGGTRLALLDAESRLQLAHIDLVQAQAARFADSAALFQALGGGWRQAPEQSHAVTESNSS